MKKIVLIVLWLGVFWGKPAGASPLFFATTGSWYDFVLIENSWTEARTAAEASTYLGISGRLATSTSQGENDFILNTILPVAYYGFWMGGLQPSGESSPGDGWAWISGEAWSFTNWDNGEPNNAVPTEDFLQIYSNWVGEPLPARRLPGTWNDNPSASRFSAGYVIEYAAVPEPSAAVLFILAAVTLIPARGRASVRKNHGGQDCPREGC
jgi:hypothetical protein